MKKRKLLLAALLTAFLSASLPVLAACDTDTYTANTSQESTELLPDSSSTETSESEEVSSTLPEVEPEIPISTPMQYIRCTGNNVNLRSGAGTDYSVLGSAEKDTVYAVLGKMGNWYKTYYRNKVAYLHTSYASVFTIEKTDDKTETVLEEAYKLIGVPYVYGAIRLHDGTGRLLTGFTAQKFDCSSLVQYVFYKGANTLLNVTTRTQSTQGVAVPKNKLERGDCIYFTNDERKYNTGVERIGHVAIYLGDDYILHTASDFARIEKMTAKRWSFYVQARRFI
ncbi:MAG: C40 family peptidase [Clostridia bacterium]|nr:C40 family peptidase [Clostridia bacterium]